MPVGATLEICSLCYDRLPFLKQRFYLSSDFYAGNAWFDSVMCLFHYSGAAKDLLRKFKYYKKPGYYRAFSELLVRQLEDMPVKVMPDMTVSVPLHRKRKAVRGYNQSFLISKALSRRLRIFEGSHLLKRVRDTGSQSVLGKGARGLNVKDAFVLKSPESFTGRSILLIDDIITTGSTLNECARLLKMAGAKHVMGIAVASGRAEFF